MSFSIGRGKKGNSVFPLAWLIKICTLLLIIEKIFLQLENLLVLMLSKVSNFSQIWEKPLSSFVHILTVRIQDISNNSESGTDPQYFLNQKLSHSLLTKSSL